MAKIQFAKEYYSHVSEGVNKHVSNTFGTWVESNSDGANTITIYGILESKNRSDEKVRDGQCVWFCRSRAFYRADVDNDTEEVSLVKFKRGDMITNMKSMGLKRVTATVAPKKESEWVYQYATWNEETGKWDYEWEDGSTDVDEEFEVMVNKKGKWVHEDEESEAEESDEEEEDSDEESDYE